MREFDAICVPKVPTYKPHQIRAIRDRCNASQTVFAAYMNISPSSLQKWETGNKKPNGVAMKLLNIIDQKGLDALI
jgi:putative transcriptional regulator